MAKKAPTLEKRMNKKEIKRSIEKDDLKTLDEKASQPVK